MPDAIVIEFPRAVPEEMRKDVRAKLFYAHPLVAAVELAPDGSAATFRLREPVATPPELLGENARKIVTDMVSGFIPIRHKVYFDQRQVTPRHAGDISRELLDGGHIFRLGQGQYGFGPLFSQLMRVFDGMFRAFGAAQGAAEHAFPTLIPVETLHRCDYFTSFPHAVSFVHHLPESIADIERFMVSSTGKDLAHLDFAAARVENVLSPAVCYHVYHSLEGVRLSPAEAGRTFLCKGKCFRYEAGNMTSPERMWDFSMREIVFVGSREFVAAGREASLAWLTDLLTGLGLKCSIETATDPFFAGDAMKKKLFQKSLQLKLEILVDIPSDGHALAVGSQNIHQSFFGNAFHITQDNGEPVHTGCTAFGVERFVLAFLAQYGLDDRHWPECVRAPYAAAP